MTNVILVLTVVGIVNIILLFINLSIFKDLILMKVLITQMHNLLGVMGNKLQSQENYLHKIGNAFTEFTTLIENITDKLNSRGPFGMMGTMYKTMDGKYAASSLEELVDKIKADGNEDNYLSSDELEELRRMFDDDGDDDDDDDSFNPNKG